MSEVKQKPVNLTKSTQQIKNTVPLARPLDTVKTATAKTRVITSSKSIKSSEEE